METARTQAINRVKGGSLGTYQNCLGVLRGGAMTDEMVLEHLLKLPEAQTPVSGSEKL
jgi:hypothetical protein